MTDNLPKRDNPDDVNSEVIEDPTGVDPYTDSETVPDSDDDDEEE